MVISKNIKILKENRVQADYQQNDFTIKETNNIYDTALNTLKLINNSFE